MIRHVQAMLSCGVVLALAAAVPRPSNAALRQLSFEELTRESRHIVTAEVLSLRSYESGFEGQAFAGRGECMFTDVRLRVRSVLKGPFRATQEITVQVLGGRIGDAWMRCLESETYEVGETVLLFLREVGGKLRATGWLQGKFTLRDDGGVLTVVGKRGLPITTSMPLETVSRQVTLLSSSESSSSQGTSGDGTGASFKSAETTADRDEDRSVQIRRVSEGGEE